MGCWSTSESLASKVKGHSDIAMYIHGNPNVLTRDIGTSLLSQGRTGQHALVELERFDGVAPPVRAFERPAIEGARRSPP